MNASQGSGSCFWTEESFSWLPDRRISVPQGDHVMPDDWPEDNRLRLGAPTSRIGSAPAVHG